MAIDYKFSDDAVEAMLGDGSNNGLRAFCDSGTGEPAWGLYSADTGLANPNAVPTGTLRKWGFFDGTNMWAAPTNSVNNPDATRRWDLVLNAEGSQKHNSTGTVDTLALFKDVGDLISVSIPTDFTAANLIAKGNCATSDAWCIMTTLTLSAADIDVLQGNCKVGMLNSHTTGP